METVSLYNLARKHGMNEEDSMRFAVKTAQKGSATDQKAAEKELSIFAAAIGIPIVIGVAAVTVADDLLLNIPSTIVCGVLGGLLDLF